MLEIKTIYNLRKCISPASLGLSNQDSCYRKKIPHVGCRGWDEYTVGCRAGSRLGHSYFPLAMRLSVIMSSLVRRNWRVLKSIVLYTYPFKLIIHNLFDVFMKSLLNLFKNY